MAEKYEDIARRYPADILAKEHLASFIQFQVGRCLAGAYTAERRTAAGSTTWQRSIAAFEKALSVDKATPYRIQTLENIAAVADSAGQKQISFEAYKRLYEIAGEQYHKDEGNAGARERMTGYLRSMLSRADGDGGVETAIALCKSIIEREGIQSDDARYTLFFMADLYFMRKDLLSAAATYSEFVKT